MHREVIQKIAANILAAVQTFHAANPQRAGISREELQATLKLNPDFLDAAAESLLQSKQLERNGALLARAGWNARIPDRDQRLCDQIAAKLQQAGWAPPGLEELAAAAERAAAARDGDGAAAGGARRGGAAGRPDLDAPRRRGSRQANGA